MLLPTTVSITVIAIVVTSSQLYLKQQLRVANETRQPNLKDFLWSDNDE